MAVVPASLQAPAGELEDVLFQGLTPVQITARLQAYIDDAVAKSALLTDATQRDSFTIAWAYYRAYRAQAERLAAQPASASLQGLGSMSTSVAQLDFFNRQSVEWLRIANGYLTLQTPPNLTRKQGTAPITNTVKW